MSEQRSHRADLAAAEAADEALDRDVAAAPSEADSGEAADLEYPDGSDRRSSDAPLATPAVDPPAADVSGEVPESPIDASAEGVEAIEGPSSAHAALAGPGSPTEAAAPATGPPADDEEWAQAIEQAVSGLPTLEPEVVEGSVEAPPPDKLEPAPGPTPPSTSDDGLATSSANGTAPTAPRRPLPRIIAVANQKGGVGKTTTAVNLGAGLAELGYRVLVVDLDPQGNATTGVGINVRGLSCSVYDVLLSETPLENCIEPTAVRNLFVAPATIDLAGAEIELVSAFSRELKLRRALDELAGDYDYTLIDCPPSLGLLTVNGLAAAGEVLVPIQCEYYALEGLGQLLRNVQLVQSNLNPRLELSAIVLTMYDARTRLADQVATEVRSHFGPKVCRNIIPRTVRLSEAPSFGQPIIVFDSTSRGALAYRELAKEVSGGAPQRVG